jgi:hypothetical protein
MVDNRGQERIIICSGIIQWFGNELAAGAESKGQQEHRKVNCSFHRSVILGQYKYNTGTVISNARVSGLLEWVSGLQFTG